MTMTDTMQIQYSIVDQDGRHFNAGRDIVDRQQAEDLLEYLRTTRLDELKALADAEAADQEVTGRLTNVQRQLYAAESARTWHIECRAIGHWRLLDPTE